MNIKRILSVLLFCFLSLNIIGCESFSRKFVRKSKKPDAAIELVLTPEEYKGPNMSKEEIYRQYYLYWSSWQDELINALTQKASLKKKIDCAQEALKNLVNMKMMLVEAAQNNFEPEIAKLNDLLFYIKNDVYGSNNNRNISVAERIKANIHKNFVYPKIRNYLK
ncbi:MAG TPA: hypothetical protein PL125_00060 [Candidatus Omnitrophota bacterium]|nr:hypothetical protein [Candidatus Omnitrophota bacterium]HPT38582.1 hypothetical protein [Candidatus Omnitrophota bacterium]